MSDVVIDSCVAVKWILTEDDASIAIELLREITASGGRLIVLDFGLVEVTNAIWKRFHRGLASSDETQTMFGFLEELPCVVEPARPHLERALAIARDYRRSVYDALFVALAESLGVEGITADVPLFNAVKGAFPNVRLLGDR